MIETDAISEPHSYAKFELKYFKKLFETTVISIKNTKYTCLFTYKSFCQKS